MKVHSSKSKLSRRAVLGKMGLAACGLFVPRRFLRAQNAQPFGGFSIPYLKTSSSLNPYAGLVAYWKADEGGASGSRADFLGANNLTDVNNDVPSHAGLINNGTDFTTNANEQLTHADNATLGVGSGVSFTLVMWFQIPGSIVNGAAIISKWGASAALQDFLVNFSSTGYPGGELHTFFNWSDGSATHFISDPNHLLHSFDGWTMLAAGFDNSLQQAWIQNGVPTGGGSPLPPAVTARTSGSATQINRSATALTLGNYNGGGLAPACWLDEVGLWHRSLSVAEVTTLYNSGNGMQPH